MDGRERLNRDGERVLAWDGCINVRDLGGLAMEDGRATRFGVVVRADSIRGLTEDGWRALADYGVERAIDLRADEEVAQDPPDAAPIPCSVSRSHRGSWPRSKKVGRRCERVSSR